jgi:hypothetical protein
MKLPDKKSAASLRELAQKKGEGRSGVFDGCRQAKAGRRLFFI